jgi:hypothetical protein
MKTTSCFLFVLLPAVILTVSPGLHAQNLETKKAIANFKDNAIPDFKKSIVSMSKNEKLGEIQVEVDFGSFGNNAAEIDAAVSQLLHAKAALVSITRNAAAREEVEKQIKKIVIKFEADEAKRKASVSDASLLICSHSFSMSKLFSSVELERMLEKSL